MRSLFFMFWLGMAAMGLAKEEAALWHDGRITPEQPFKAEVIGVIPGWGGDTVILKEIGEGGKYCMAHLVMHHFVYRVISEKELEDVKAIGHATFISPGVEVQRFSWSMGVHELGRRFGEKDFVKQWYAKSAPARVVLPE